MFISTVYTYLQLEKRPLVERRPLQSPRLAAVTVRLYGPAPIFVNVNHYTDVSDVLAKFAYCGVIIKDRAEHRRSYLARLTII